ncbi:thioredoxin [Haemophilus influenzae PittHH]|nr:thioredoxin [Haemophilus influenzae PittHH]
MKIKKLLKNGLSLFLTFIVITSILDFVRRPVVSEEINKITLQDLQGNTFSLESLDQNKPTLLYFGELGVVIVVILRQQLIL